MPLRRRLLLSLKYAHTVIIGDGNASETGGDALGICKLKIVLDSITGERQENSIQ